MILRSLFRPVIFSVGLFLLLGLAGPVRGDEWKPDVVYQAKAGETYYTQFSFFHQKHIHKTTNYRLTDLVPINTPVTFVRLKLTAEGGQGEKRLEPAAHAEIIVKLPDGKELRIINEKKYTKKNLDEIFVRTLAKEKVDLSPFTQLERTNILKGTIDLGMSRAAVLRAMGYPPAHKTKSLTLNTWYYWSDEDNNFPVMFRDDKVMFAN